ncbi:TRAP transporter large permease subunit [Aquamicrobium sp. cd-1]|uniref:TRAP transporter large permease subunit n=2 Tax=Aquamicrobium zhengzhouense TaxID=2781738 RepID=A0ABS0SG25_9HYPH|nr:TRAP transporter large permease subunit [Aquamicrobium zhengzhouense]
MTSNHTRLQRMLADACGLTLLAMLALSATSIVMRYGFGTGHVGTEESLVWMLVLLTCLGFPLVAGGPLAMRIELFRPREGSTFQLVRDVIAEAIVWAASLTLLLSGVKAAMQVGGTSPLLGIGEWLRPAALAVGGGLALVIRLMTLVSQKVSWRYLAVVFLLASIPALTVAFGKPISTLPPSAAAACLIGVAIIVAAPLPHAFILAGHVALIFGSPLVEPALALSLLGGIGRYLLLAIPFFLLAGGLLIVSGLADDLVRFAASLVGRRKAGLGQTVLLTSVMFSGISGSSIANAAFSAKTFQRPLVANGYLPERAAAIIAATAVLDNIIPPSIAFFILATATNLPVGPLLIGGLVAGLFLAAALAIAIRLASGNVAPPPVDPLPRRTLAFRALPVFGLALLVVLGIRFGIVTPTEAAGMAALYTLGAVLLAQRSLGRALEAFRQSATEAASIVMLIGAASPLAFLIAVDGVAASAAVLARSLGDNPYMVMLAASLLLLVVGLVLDIGAAILLFAPILLPVALAVGIDRVNFGVILVVNLMIGGLTPPVGILVQVVSAATHLPAVRLFYAVLPYLLALLLALLCLSVAAVALPKIF